MRLDLKLCKIVLVIMLTLYHLNLMAETIPALVTKTFQIDQYFTAVDYPYIKEKTWQAVCHAIGLPPTDVPGGWWCGVEGPFVVSYAICSDGSIKPSPYLGPEATIDHCENSFSMCPDSSWLLSDDKKTCSRPDDACWKNIENVSEVKLLAAIAYAESHWSNVYEEMAGIASATIRRRDAAHSKSVIDLVKKNESFSYVVYNGNERFKKLMCGEEEKFKKAYDAAVNALQYGKDYSNGGCFWDGYDLKTTGVNHYKYSSGFKYSDPSHNIFSTPAPPLKQRKGRKQGFYDTTYVSTATQGRTIFWKLDKQFLYSNGAAQCN